MDQKNFNILSLPEKVATLDCSFKSQITTLESEVPVPKMRPSGWNWPVVSVLSDVWLDTLTIYFNDIQLITKFSQW